MKMIMDIQSHKNVFTETDIDTFDGRITLIPRCFLSSSVSEEMNLQKNILQNDNDNHFALHLIGDAFLI